MVKSILSVIALTLVAASARAALPGNEAQGKRLHDASCTGCHDASVYTRQDHRVRSLEGLKQQVENCTHMAQEEFSPADKRDILKYLNDDFYHFDEAGKP